jgi:hypothetical protein
VLGTKSDQLISLEKSIGDENMEFVVQLLRAAAMQFSASLCFTSQNFDHDKLVAVRKLLLEGSFNSKPNVVDRSNLLIPEGWDNVGKISVTQPFQEAYLLKDYGYWDAILSAYAKHLGVESSALTKPVLEQAFETEAVLLTDMNDVQTLSTVETDQSSGTASGSQNQVLSNFFQSLLTKKAPTAGTRGAVEAELNRMKPNEKL